VSAAPTVPESPLPLSCPFRIAVTVRDALASASLSVCDYELVSITSPECSPVAS